jgi:hypothetical protein
MTKDSSLLTKLPYLDLSHSPVYVYEHVISIQIDSKCVTVAFCTQAYVI